MVSTEQKPKNDYEEVMLEEQLLENNCPKRIVTDYYKHLYPTKFLLTYPENLKEWASNHGGFDDNFELPDKPRTRESIINWMNETPQINVPLIMQTGW